MIINHFPAVSKGGGGGSVEGGVVFYDYDGTVVQTYTPNEFAALSAMPANPSHTGLVAQGWNWSLSDAKTYVAKYGNLNIGQMYITQSGATEIDVVMQKGRLSPILTIAVNGTITVDWGDNTTPDTVTGTSLSTRLEAPHTYAQAGAYTISISATGDNKYRFYGSSTYTLLRKNTTQNENKVYANTIRHVRIGSNAEIGANAFYSCHALASITIPDTVTSIGGSAFSYCYSLVSVTIPDSVTSVESNTFSYCYSITSITIPDDVTSIRYAAFYYCYSLTNFTIPDSVTSMGTSVFYYCYALADVTIPDDVTSAVDYMFTYCYTLPSITIPDGVTSIGKQAFYSCYSLSSVTIPEDVTSIGDNAFSSCYGVKEYHILPTTPPTAGTTIFNNIVSDCVIYVPSASLETYKTATNWSTYASKMQAEP